MAGINMNPVWQHEDGTWWFWIETWADEMGPYATYEEAEKALEEYAKTL